eukprot:SAG31_NODE_56_length_29726_cov_41.443312_8_plen_100_part_00
MQYIREFTISKFSYRYGSHSSDEASMVIVMNYKSIIVYPVDARARWNPSVMNDLGRRTVATHADAHDGDGARGGGPKNLLTRWDRSATMGGLRSKGLLR